MKGIVVNNALILRRMRHKIIEICDYIYERRWDKVSEYFEELVLAFSKNISENVMCSDTLRLASLCIQKKNYVRLRDLLLHEIDFYIVDQLLAVKEQDRKLLSEEARRENEKSLASYHKDISRLICDMKSISRIECSYTGTENINISIIEGSYAFRLFSSINPWMESSDLINDWRKGEIDEVYILGFGGGYFIEEVLRKLCQANIKVYLPNIDIFKTVICNIPVSNILQNERLEFCYDPTCLNYLLILNEKMQKDTKFGFYIDRQELRACCGNAIYAKKLIQEYKSEFKICDIEEKKKKETVGKQIDRYIKQLSI